MIPAFFIAAAIILVVAVVVATVVVAASLTTLIEITRRLGRLETIMLSLKEALAQINDATNSQGESLANIAADLQFLKNKTIDPADQAELERLATALTAQAEFSKSLAASTTDPVPTEPPETPPSNP